MAEEGVPDAEANTFYGLVAPAGTPASIIRQINAAMNEGLQSVEIQALFAGLGSEAKVNSAQDFAAYIAAQNKKWKEVGKAAGVKVD
jgi:tripartite-type tricarboxylate transporter receptor subunit TctC